MVDKKLRVLDLFVGCGGLTDGFEQTGKFDTIACVEWEAEPCRTLRKRLAEKWGYKNTDETVIQFDIQRVNQLLSGYFEDGLFPAHKGLKALVENKGGVDVIVGGPPCQAYSVAGRIRDENGMHDDYRNFLFESYVAIVNEFRPKAFIFENVPGMLSAAPNGVSIVKRITEAFDKIGYEIVGDLRNFALIDSSSYGVPQSRRRVVIIGVERGHIKANPQVALLDFYKSILPKYCSSKVLTVRDAIGDLPKLFPLSEPTLLRGRIRSHYFQHYDVSGHVPRKHSIRDMKIFEDLALDIESKNYKYISTDSIKELYFERTGNRSNVHKYYVLRWDRPSNTIPAHLYKDGLRHIHPDPAQKRSITVREAARLQSFDDDFEFTGSMTDQYKMIGNAVPPKLANAIAMALTDFLWKYYAL